jgi:hypothetical protein
VAGTGFDQQLIAFRQVLASTGFDQQLKAVRQVLDKVREYKLLLQPSKCSFCVRHVVCYGMC